MIKIDCHVHTRSTDKYGSLGKTKVTARVIFKILKSVITSFVVPVTAGDNSVIIFIPLLT